MVDRIGTGVMRVHGEAQMRVRHIAVLGSTGSIGTSTLDVVARHPDRFRVTVLAAGSREDDLFSQCLRFQPRYAFLADPAAAARVGRRLRDSGSHVDVLSGTDALVDLVRLAEVDTVMAAIVGAAGLRSTLAAAAAGKRVLLANKESLVMAGPVFMDAVLKGNAALFPVDSEHNAVFQALPRDFAGDIAGSGIRRILLTASGGPFRRALPESLDAVTPEQACAHPNWIMGRKISVDSATMMNKGLEVIEARWLFNAPHERIKVVIHPQSIVHSLVEYVDGSVIAQLGNPDMRTPIAHALGYPDRIEAGVERFDLPAIGALSFEEPDPRRFPCLGLAYDALREGGSASTLLNAANEVAVASFLDRGLPFPDIARLNADVLAEVPATRLASLDDVIEADARGRRAALDWIGRRTRQAAATRMRAGQR
jgi:1-deoxy-D-xylulose-5-phosphate reductoisomerase